MLVHVSKAFVFHTWCILLNLDRGQHCELLGYHPVKKLKKLASPHISSHGSPQIIMGKPNVLDQSSPAISNTEVTPSGGAFQLPAANVSHDLAGRQGQLIIDSHRKSKQGKFYWESIWMLVSNPYKQAHASGWCLVPIQGLVWRGKNMGIL